MVTKGLLPPLKIHIKFQYIRITEPDNYNMLYYFPETIRYKFSISN